MIEPEIEPNDQKVLDGLNAEIERAIAARRAWLNYRLAQYAAVPIGSDIYDVVTGLRLGVVTEHYRYLRERDNLCHDTDFVIEYKYQTDTGFADHTGHQPFRLLGTIEDVQEYRRRHAVLPHSIAE